MSRKIPFLQMFAALTHWTELAQAVADWLILTAEIDRGARTAVITVEGAEGAGTNLIAQLEETLARAYRLNRVQVRSAQRDEQEKREQKPDEKEPVK